MPFSQDNLKEKLKTCIQRLVKTKLDVTENSYTVQHAKSFQNFDLVAWEIDKRSKTGAEWLQTCIPRPIKTELVVMETSNMDKNYC